MFSSECECISVVFVKGKMSSMVCMRGKFELWPTRPLIREGGGPFIAPKVGLTQHNTPQRKRDTRALTHTHPHAHTHKQTHTHTYTCTDKTHTHPCTHTHTHTTHTHTHTHTHIHTKHTHTHTTHNTHTHYTQHSTA